MPFQKIMNTFLNKIVFAAAMCMTGKLEIYHMFINWKVSNKVEDSVSTQLAWIPNFKYEEEVYWSRKMSISYF